MNNLRILLALALSFLPLANASAGNGTITTKDAGGVTRTFSIVTDGSGNFIARQVICDQSAAANCAGVNASNQLAIAAASGAFASGALASGSVASGAVASGAFASGSISSGAIAAGAQVDLLTMRGTKNAGTAAANSLLAGGVYNSTPLTLTDTQQASLQFDANGYLKINVVAGGAGGGAVTVADGADLTEGAIADAAATQGSTGTISAKLRTVTAQLNTIASNTGAAVSTTQSGATGNLISCDSHVFKHITSATDTLAVQGVSAKTIYVCGWRSRAAGVATWFLENTASTNANCSSSNTQITGVATEAANTGEVLPSAFWAGTKNTAGNGLCINSTGTGGVDVDIWYTQF